MPGRRPLSASAVVVSLLLIGCGSDSSGVDDYSTMIHFKDDAVTNASPGDSMANLEFLDQSGKTIRLRDYAGKKNLVLVFTRGYAGSFCIYCSTYTSGLISNYRAITDRDTEVIVVFPVAKPEESRRLTEFVERTSKVATPGATTAPFPTVLDVGLKAVKALDIRKDLSKPATYILDKAGRVRFAYVGSTLSDRPSIKVILNQLDALSPGPELKSRPMTADSPLDANPVQDPDGFLGMARRLSLLDDKAIRKLADEVRTGGASIADLALREGLLDAIQIYIVETLLHPDDAIPGYEILDVIGQGGMGIVFRARQKSLDRVVAIKTILVGQTHDQTTLARFEQEAFAVAKLRHPNIVAAYDLGRHQGKLYFVMELIDGQDVERLIETQGPFDETTTWGLLRQASAGLAHAAAAGIVHRDIKPANLLLVEPPAGFEIAGGQKMVKITDFGLAFLTQDIETKTRLTMTNVAIGSPHYLAPEQLEGDAFDHRVDIYSLGATAYHMLSGEPPFHGKKLPQVIAQKLAAESLDVRARSPEVSSASAELVRRMTQRDPARRISSYAELFAEIDALSPVNVKRGAPPRRVDSLAPTQIIRSDPTPEQLAIPAIDFRGGGSRSPKRRKFLKYLVGGFIGVLGVVLGVWGLWPARAQKPVRMLVPTGLDVNLFDGMSLIGWRTQSGGWRVQKNAEGGRVLSGTSGKTSHVLVKQVGNKKIGLTRFSLAVVIQLHGATAAEIEFGIDDSSGENGDRYVARLEKLSGSIGHRPGDASPFVRLTDLEPLPHAGSDPHTLTVQRQPGFWQVLLDEKPIGTVPIRATQREAPSFTLVAEEGEVWFSDITVQELALPHPESNEASAP